MKLFLLGFLTTLSFSVFAHEGCGENHHPELIDLMNLKRVISWHAASDQEVQSAFCLRKNPFSLKEMSEWLEKNSSAKIQKKVNGISFENESPENLEAFELLTTYTDIIGKKIPEKHKDFVSSCKQVDCAVKEIFGKEVGPQLLYMQRRFGMNGSHLTGQKADAWKKEELDEVLLALSDFPDGVLPLEKSRTLVHAPRTLDSGNTLANAVIMIFDLWNRQSPEQRRATILHELGHALAGVTEVDESDRWMALSGWVPQKRIKNGEEVREVTLTRPGTTVSRYGQSNEHEDFAESVVAYRYNPEGLKKASPEKYAFIRETIFDNVEYTSPEACLHPERFSKTVSAEVSEKAQKWSPGPQELSTLSNQCSKLAITNLAESQEIDLASPEFTSCYQSALDDKFLSLLNEEIAALPDGRYLSPMVRNLKVKISQEKQAEFIEEMRKHHRDALKRNFAQAMSHEQYCHQDLRKYAYQRHEERPLGVRVFTLAAQLGKIADQQCGDESKIGAPTSLVDQMIR